MPGWGVWATGGLGLSTVVSTTVALRCALRHTGSRGHTPIREQKNVEHTPRDSLEPFAEPRPLQQPRVLIVDDDDLLRLVLRTTLTAGDYVVEEASSAEEASELARFWRPAFVVLDVGLPRMSGLALCRELKEQETFGHPKVILLTGEDIAATDARRSHADALLRKPFSPLDLLRTLERLADERFSGVFGNHAIASERDQLLAYAEDLGRLLQIERAQRRLLQHSYRQTVVALADALEAKDPVTGIHALRVQRYALELTAAVDGSLLDDPSLEYGFLLHDVGKIGVPDRILNKPGPLDRSELELMQQHPVTGAELLREVALIRGEGIRVVRSHHERWDGRGYPDQLAEHEIPLGARIFALADTLDAMTNDRPYRGRRPWQEAVEEILAQDGSQFDPAVVSAFAAREPRLHRIYEELTPNVA
jgi:response regulator RpfG family c-di-GMP phosphodiesterase